MPGWHERTKHLLKDGTLQTVGIILEQHPDRCRLFMQWKQMDWPIMVDSMNLIGAPLVPLTYLVDEAGVVRKVGPDGDDLQRFMNAEPAASEPVRPPSVPDLEALVRAARGSDTQSQAQLGAQLLLWGGPEKLDGAIAALERAVEGSPDRGDLHFRLGVALRRRFDSARRRTDDFARAVAQWEAALGTDPNQYIWRRRIQQFGPRLDKPYPFYDWVDQARADIRDRGGEPVELRIEPDGAEIAQPARQLTSDAFSENPDPDGRILRDAEHFIEVQSVVVPHTYGDGRAVRVHLFFTPNQAFKAHWNNEGGPLEVWVDPPDGWSVAKRRLTVVNQQEAVSTEVRHVEFELHADDGAVATGTISAYGLYYVCEGVRGVCLYRRTDMDIPINLE